MNEMTMTGLELVERALFLLNYTDAQGRTEARQNAELLRRAKPLVEQILTDVLVMMNRSPVTVERLSDPLPVDGKTARNVMTYGVAMLLAQSENDGDSQAMMAAIYNQKRGSVNRPSCCVADVLPAPIF